MRNNTKKGFTLVELLVVIAILAILATVSVVGYTSFIEGSAVQVDEDLATQLNHFLAAYKVNHKGDINENNILEVTEEILELAGIEELRPQADKYGYHFYYDLQKDEFVSLHDDKALGTDEGVVGGLTKALAAGEGEEEPAFANRVGNSFTDGRRYYLVDTAGSYADVLNLIYDFSGNHTDLAKLYRETLPSHSIGEKVTTAMHDLVFVTNEGNFVISLNDTHTIPVVNFTAPTNEVIIARLKTDIDGNKEQINAQDPLVTIQFDTTIEVPGDVKIVANALVIGTTNDATANIIIDAESWEELYENVDAGFTNPDTVVTVGGQDYLVNGESVYDSTGTKVMELQVNFTVAKFNLKVNDKDFANKVKNRTDVANEGYVAIDIDGGFTFDFIDVADVDGNPASMSTVSWAIEELVINGATITEKLEKYITITNNTFVINKDENGCLYLVDKIVVKATSDEPVDKYVPDEEKVYADCQYTVNVVRITGFESLKLDNDSLADSFAELICKGGTETKFAISAELRYNHNIDGIVVGTGVALDYVHVHTAECCDHVHDEECWDKSEASCNHTCTSECFDCKHEHTDFDNYCCAHKHTNECYTGKCSHVPGGDHGGANSPCLIPNHHNCLTTDACLTNCSHIPGGNHGADADGATDCLACLHTNGDVKVDQRDYVITYQYFQCPSCPNINTLNHEKEDGTMVHVCYWYYNNKYMGTKTEKVCDSNIAGCQHTSGHIDTCYGACEHNTHTVDCVGTCSHTTHADECYNCTEATHKHTDNCVNVCTHTHTATECNECTHKCTDDPNKDGNKGDCLECAHSCVESDECGTCNHVCHVHEYCTDECPDDCTEHCPADCAVKACTFNACKDRRATVADSYHDKDNNFFNAVVTGKGDCQGQLTITVGGHFTTTVDIAIYDSFDIEINDKLTHVGSIDDASKGVITKEKDENDKEKDVINLISGNTIKVEDLFKTEIPEGAIIMIFDKYTSDDTLMNVNRTPLTVYSDASEMGATCWTADNVIERVNGVWEEIQLYGTRDEVIYIAVLVDAVFDEDTGALISAKRLSEDVAVKVVEGKNVRDVAELDGTQNNVLLDDIRIPNTTNATNKFSFTGVTVYGNHHTFNIENGVNVGWGIISLVNAHMQDLRVVGALYPQVTIAGDEEWGSNAIYATGTSSLTNCYVSNCRAPLMAGQEDNFDKETGAPTDEITINNCVFFGGRYANIDLRSGTLNIKGTVITINQPHTNEETVTANTVHEIGLGVVVWLEAKHGTNIQGIEKLVQYNFVPETYDNFEPITVKQAGMTVNIATQEIFDYGFANADAGQKFGTDTIYLNSGIVGADIGEGLGGVVNGVLDENQQLPTGNRVGFSDENPATNRDYVISYVTPTIEHEDPIKQGIIQTGIDVLSGLGAKAQMHFYTFDGSKTNQDIFTASQNAEYIYSPWNQTVAGHTNPYAAYDFGADGDITTAGK